MKENHRVLKENRPQQKEYHKQMELSLLNKHKINISSNKFTLMSIKIKVTQSNSQAAQSE
jgi:hypothetical protein